MEIPEFWQAFKATHPAITNDHYDAWSFGSTAKMADDLAALVKSGRKTATTSALDLYEADESLPVVGEYNIILDSHDHPVCVTQTKVVETVPFDQVSQEHAYHEGEDDRSLTMWQQGHEQFFKAAYHEMGRDFNFQIPCVCEAFERID